MSNELLITGIAATVVVWAVLRFAPVLWANRPKLPSLKPTKPEGPCSLSAAGSFIELRNFFAATGQTGRVKLMDADLAAGVFATKTCPADDLKAAILRMPAEVEGDE